MHNLQAINIVAILIGITAVIFLVKKRKAFLVADRKKQWNWAMGLNSFGLGINIGNFIFSLFLKK